MHLQRLCPANRKTVAMEMISCSMPLHQGFTRNYLLLVSSSRLFPQWSDHLIGFGIATLSSFIFKRVISTIFDLQPGNPLPEGLTEDDYNLDATILRDLLFSTINKKLLLSVPRRATPYEIFQTLRAKFGNRDTLYGNLLELKREYRLTDTSTSAVDRLQSQLNTMCELSLELDSPLDISTQIIMVKEAIPRNLPMVLAYINKDYQDIAALFRELKLILSQMQPRSNHSRKRHCK